MSNKKIMTITIIGTVLIFLGALLMVVDILKSQDKEKREQEKEILTYYTEFKKYASKFADKRQEYTEKVVENLYPESVNQEYKTWIEELDSYKNLVDKAIIPAKSLKKLCVGKVYSNKDIQNDCTAYVINYETIMNYFVKDVEEFNLFITDYLKENKSNEVKTYNLDSKNYYYLDVDDDGKFIGKD